MSLDIGTAFREGFSRTFARNGLILVAVFVAIALLTSVLFQSLVVEGLGALVEYQEGLTPEEMGMSPEEYQETLDDLRTVNEDTRANLSLAVGLPLGISAAGLLVLALASEAANVVAIRVFATEETADMPSGIASENIVLATLNGFVGGLVAWGLILVGSAFLLVPGIFLAVAFFFLRQEVALNDKNFVQAMADSWRLTRGNRLNVFALGLVLVVLVWTIFLATGGVVGLVSTVGADIATAVLGGLVAGGGLLGVFGAAVATRAYVQLTGSTPGEEDGADREDPYDAALGPDDIPE